MATNPKGLKILPKIASVSKFQGVIFLSNRKSPFNPMKVDQACDNLILW